MPPTLKSRWRATSGVSIPEPGHCQVPTQCIQRAVTGVGESLFAPPPFQKPSLQSLGKIGLTVTRKVSRSEEELHATLQVMQLLLAPPILQQRANVFDPQHSSSSSSEISTQHGIAPHKAWLPEVAGIGGRDDRKARLTLSLQRFQLSTDIDIYYVYV